MRSRPHRDLRDEREKNSISRVAEWPPELKRRIAATVMVHERGYSASQIAHQFGWDLEDVKRWMESGRPLL
jgi:transposase-like protein